MYKAIAGGVATVAIKVIDLDGVPEELEDARIRGVVLERARWIKMRRV